MAEGRNLPSPLFDPEVNRSINEALPEVVVDAFGIVTRLGDGATLVAVAVLLYWFASPEERTKRAMVLAIAVSTLALVAGLKGIFEVQRPLFAAEPPFAFAPETYPGWSTPSAHSMGAAAVYGALAVVIDAGKRWQRYVVAGAIIVTVPLSRVVLGVHYVGDVISGTVLGLALVAIALRITKRSITPMFALSLGIAVAAFLLGSEEFVTMSIGASLGGLIAWNAVEKRSVDPLGASMLLLGILVLAVLFAVRLFTLVIPLDSAVLTVLDASVTLAAVVETAGYAAAFGGAIVVPHVAARFDDTEAVRRLQTVLPFSKGEIDPDAVGEEPTVSRGGR